MPLAETEFSCLIHVNEPAGPVVPDEWRILWESFYEAMLETSPHLSPDVLAMKGSTGRRYRRAVNNIVSKTHAARYMEVGAWFGSTICSALSGNHHAEGIAIDNWSEFNGPKDKFLENVEKYCPRGSVQHIEADFRNMDFRSLSPIDVYLFDGPHMDIDQFDGIVKAVPALATTSIIIVDDWNFPPARSGTLRAFSEIGLDVLGSIDIRTTDGDHPKIFTSENSDWHNGVLFAVVKR